MTNSHNTCAHNLLIQVCTNAVQSNLINSNAVEIVRNIFITKACIELISLKKSLGSATKHIENEVWGTIASSTSRVWQKMENTCLSTLIVNFFFKKRQYFTKYSISSCFLKQTTCSHTYFITFEKISMPHSGVIERKHSALWLTFRNG